jgi:hypothetical protein
MQIEQQTPFLDDEFDPDEALMSDEEFDRELALAAEGRFEDLGLHEGTIPGFERRPLTEFLAEG